MKTLRWRVISTVPPKKGPAIRYSNSRLGEHLLSNSAQLTDHYLYKPFVNAHSLLYHRQMEWLFILYDMREEWPAFMPRPVRSIRDNRFLRLALKRSTDKTWLNAFQQRYSVKERIFLFYMFFFAGLALLTILANILSGFDFSFNYKWMGISGFCAVMGLLGVRRIRTALVHRVGVYMLSLVILPVSWLSSAGLMSPSMVYSVVTLLLINFLLAGIERFVLNAVFLCVNLALISLYHFRPELFLTLTAEEQFLDWIVNIPMIFVFTALLLTTFERAYERERMVSVDKTRKLAALSQTDSLTGLQNRRHLDEDIDERVGEYRDRGTPFSIIVLDVDYFKQFNDAYGHLQGDQCLRRIASLLQAAASRSGDKVYRFGGEEFLLVLKDTDRAGALSFARRLEADIDEAAIPHKQSGVASIITASMGIATCNARNADSQTLLKQADTALYQAKESGRNGIVCFEG